MEKDAPRRDKTFPAGSYIIDLDQPQRIFIKSILEQDTPQDKAFVDDNMARFRRNQMRGKGQPKEDYGFYDITAWSLPLAFGVDAWWTEETANVAGSMVDAAHIENAKTRRRDRPGGDLVRHSVRNRFDGRDGDAAAAERLQGSGRDASTKCRRP